MDSKISAKQIWAFALPSVAVAWLIPPMYAILADFYLRYTEATAAGIGTAMLGSKILDAVTDPPVGYMSDHTSSRWGARKPWILVGAIIGAVTFIFFFDPPEGAGNLYFAVCIIFYYIAYTLIAIPTRSWLGELTPEYAERSRIWSKYVIGLLIGGVLIMLLPILLSSSVFPFFKSSEFDREMVSFLGKVGAVALLISVWGAIKWAPDGTRNIGQRPTYKEFFTILKTNKPFQVFLWGYGASALGFGVFYSVIIVALTSYFGLTDKVPLFMLAVIFAQVVTIPYVERLARRYPKHKVWAYSWMLHVVVGPIILLFDQNTDSFLLFMAVGCVASILQGAHMLFPASIMNDIIDYDTMKTGLSRSGVHMSVFTFVDKAIHAVGFALGFYILAIFEYDAKSTTHSDFSSMGLMIAVVVVPNLLFALSAYFLMKFPIDERRHKIIRRRIDRKDQRMAAASG
ncbi:MAG: MFS transporter [Kordiimonadaceae bacterium]|nr:MFS transporter [Kordiimonadaceae bacterium]